MASVVPEASIVPSRSARTDRPVRPTGLQSDSGFASLLDEARPDDRPSDRTQAQPRDRMNPAEKTKASSEIQPSDKRAGVSDNPASPSTNDTAVAPGEVEAGAAVNQPALGLNKPALTPDAAAVVPPAEGAKDETRDAIVTDGTAAETPAVQQAAVIVPPLPQPAPIPTIHAGVPATTQTEIDKASPDAPALPALSDDASPAPAVPPLPPAARQTPAVDAPSDSANVKPHPSHAQDEQLKTASATAPAEPATSSSGNPDAAAAAEAGSTSGKVKAQAAEAGVPLSAEAKTDADAKPTESPKQSKPAQNPPARTEATFDSPSQQADIAAASDDAALSAKTGIDPWIQPAQIANPIPAHSTATHGMTPQAAPVSAAQPIPINAVAVEIAAQARAGNSRFEIRLDPPELGRIDVRLDIDNDGNVKSRLIIERTDTYDLLRRDQSTLERALNQAGLKTSDNALEFSLRDQGFAQQRDKDDTPRSVKAMIGEADIAPGEVASGYSRLLGARGGLDIRV